MKRFLTLGAAVCLPVVMACPVRARCQAPAANRLPSPAADPNLAAALRTISPDAIHADIAHLVSFGTRNTLSSMDPGLPPSQGINAAADWIESQFRAISADCGGCLEVKRDSFVQQPTSFNGRPAASPAPPVWSTSTPSSMAPQLTRTRPGPS